MSIEEYVEQLLEHDRIGFINMTYPYKGTSHVDRFKEHVRKQVEMYNNEEIEDVDTVTYNYLVNLYKVTIVTDKYIDKGIVMDKYGDEFSDDRILRRLRYE